MFSDIEIYFREVTRYFLAKYIFRDITIHFRDIHVIRYFREITRCNAIFFAITLPHNAMYMYMSY